MSIIEQEPQEWFKKLSIWSWVEKTTEFYVNYSEL